MTGDERGLMVKMGADDHHRTCGHLKCHENQYQLDFRLHRGVDDASDDDVVLWVVREGRFGLGWHPPRLHRHHPQCQRVVAWGMCTCASVARWESGDGAAAKRVHVDWRRRNLG